MITLSVDREMRRARKSERRGDLDQARKIYGSILEMFPDNVRARKAVAALDGAAPSGKGPAELEKAVAELFELLKQSQFPIAAEKAERLVTQYPLSFDLWFILGSAHERLGNLAKAEAAFRKAAQLKPDIQFGHDSLARTLRAQGKLEEAVEASRLAMKVNPKGASALNNHAMLLSDVGEVDEAVSIFRQALRFKPDYGLAHRGLAIALFKQGEVQEAIQSAERALQVMSEDSMLLCQKLYNQAQICDWSAFDEFAEVRHQLGLEGASVSPFSTLAFEDHPERQGYRSLYHARQTFSRMEQPVPIWPERRPGRIRVGYFTADFYDHATLYLMAGMFREHDKSRFEIFVYSYGAIRTGEMRERVSKDVEHLFDIHDMSDEAVVELVRKHQLDIAIDCKGYTADTRSRLFAYRLAPAQINYLGYPGTMGADFIDHIIADPVVITAFQRHAYTEKIINLPNCYQPNDDKQEIIPTQTRRSDFGLPEDSFVFCCFNQSYKISPREFRIWMRMLEQVDGSVLWLLSANPLAEANLRQEAQSRGVDPDRLIFAKKAPHAEHLARHKHADLFLDTFNYNAHTTARDALWAGLPVVTKAGRQFAARVGASLLSAVGLPELITASEEEYEALILKLATDSEKLFAVKSKLAENRLTEPLFDTVRYTRDFERALEAAHRATINEAKSMRTSATRQTLSFPCETNVTDARDRLLQDGVLVIAGAVPEVLLADLRQASEYLRRSEYLQKLPGARRWPIVKELGNVRPGTVSSALGSDSFDTLQVCWAHESRAGELLEGTVDLLGRVMAQIIQQPVSLIFSSLIVKAGGANETPWHQDAAFDPHSASLPPLSRLNAWLPLTAVNDASACLCHLKGSQRSRLRTHHQDPRSDSLVLQVEENEFAAEVCSTMMPGDVLIHLPTTIHRSTRNEQLGQRVAFSFNFSALYPALSKQSG